MKYSVSTPMWDPGLVSITTERSDKSVKRWLTNPVSSPRQRRWAKQPRGHHCREGERPSGVCPCQRVRKPRAGPWLGDSKKGSTKWMVNLVVGPVERADRHEAVVGPRVDPHALRRQAPIPGDHRRHVLDRVDGAEVDADVRIGSCRIGEVEAHHLLRWVAHSVYRTEHDEVVARQQAGIGDLANELAVLVQPVGVGSECQRLLGAAVQRPGQRDDAVGVRHVAKQVELGLWNAAVAGGLLGALEESDLRTR
jgi:hypothetical protein